jgi:predicted HAD superfamily hydrolase
LSNYNSFIFSQYQNFLENKDIKIISFDIFETLVFRKVSSPKDIFKKVGQKDFVKKIFQDDFTFLQYRIEAEKKARIDYSYNEDITLEEIYEKLPLTNTQKEIILNIELEEENNSLFINKEIEEFIELAIKYDKKIIFISDMYLTSDKLKKIVFAKLKNISDYKIFVSNEHKATKSSGKLFIKVKNNLKLDFCEILHIGDNEYSDINMAKTLGINVLHYNHDKYMSEIFRLESKYLKRSLPTLNNFRILSSLKNSFLSEKERFFFNIGASIFGPALWDFSNWIIDIANKKNISQINCLMREGRLFSKYISKLDKNLEVNLIYASRKSTFLPSIVIEDLEKEGFNFYNYRKFTIRNFYDLFDLKIRENFIIQNGDAFLKDANTIYLNEINLLDLIAKDVNSRIEKIKNNIVTQKKIFQKYLKQLNFKNNSILIDFGGTGSINQNINKILGEENNNTHILFYMHESGYNKLLKSVTHSFLPFEKKDIEMIRRTPEIFEILFNGNFQTTISYVEENGIVVPKTELPHTYINEMKEIIYAFDKGIDSFFDIAIQNNLGKNIFKRDELLQILSRVIELPTKIEANYLGKLYHDEGYGNVLVDNLISQNDIDFISKNLEKAYTSFKSSLSYKVGEISWIQGTIVNIDSEFLKNMNGYRQKGVNSGSIYKILNILEENKKIKSVYIYGVGQFYHELKSYLREMNINIKGLIDSRAKFSNINMDGFKVNYIEECSFYQDDVIIVSSAVYALEITDLIKKYKSSQNSNIRISIINHYNGIVNI